MHKELINWGIRIEKFIAVNDRRLQFGNLGTFRIFIALFAIEQVTSHSLQVHTVETYKTFNLACTVR